MNREDSWCCPVCGGSETQVDYVVTCGDCGKSTSLFKQDEVEELKAEIARLKSPWQPISTLPASGVYQAARYDEENTDTPECLEMVRAPMLKDGRILNLNSGNYARPGTFTHWCELPAPLDQRPAPPAEGEKEGGK